LLLYRSLWYIRGRAKWRFCALVADEVSLHGRAFLDLADFSCIGGKPTDSLISEFRAWIVLESSCGGWELMFRVSAPESACSEDCFPGAQKNDECETAEGKSSCG